jgi:hypothetical protein
MAVRDKVSAAAIWWTKARIGWKEAQDLNVGGNTPLVVDFRWADRVPAVTATTAGIEAVVEQIEHDDDIEVIWQPAGVAA